MDEPQHDVLNLRDYAFVLWRERVLVIATVITVVAVALVVTALQTPVYESSASVVLRPTEALTDASLVDQIVYTDATLQTERQIVGSADLAERVRSELDLDMPLGELTNAVDAEIVEDSQVIRITAGAGSAEQAALLAQTFADEYIEFRRERAATETAEAADALEERITSIRARIAELDAEADTATDDQAAMIDSSRTALLNQLAALETQIASLRTAGTPTGGGDVIEPAQVPAGPVSPRPLRTGVLALVLGAMLGVGLAFVRDSIQDVVNGEDDIVRATGTAVLGHIPHWDAADDHGLGVATLIEPSSAVAEAYRSLRANVRFLVGGRGRPGSLLVTSATEGDGKTTTAANLAVAFAAAGSQVVLVDADLRRPAVASAFGVPRGRGLSELLLGELDISEALTTVGVPKLQVITAGQTPPNPSELLISESMGRFITNVATVADLVIYDGPPTLAVADAVELASQIPATLLVVHAGSSRRRDLRRAVGKLASVGGEVIGAVLNDIRPSSGYYYSYYHGQYAAAVEDPDSGDRDVRDAASSPVEELPVHEAGPAPPGGLELIDEPRTATSPRTDE